MSQDLQHEELDQIGKPPSGWQLTTLGEIADVQGGITKGKQRTPNDKLREVPYLRVANVQRGFLDLGEVKTIEATEDEVRQFQLRPGDVLFNEGGDRDKLGRGWIWSGEIAECIHQNHVFRARIHGGVLVPKILSWYGNSEGQAYFLREGKQTTNLASLNSTKLRALPVLIPPGPEQQRIVAAIESYFTRLDDAVATLERVERNLKRYRASVLKSAVEGRLVPTEAALAKQEGRDFEPASILLERILTERRRRWAESGKKSKYQEPSAPDTTTVPILPKGWCWLTVDAVAFVTKLAGFEYTNFVKYDPHGDLAVIKAENAGKDGFNPTEFSYVRSESVAQLTRSRLIAGDILMVFVGAGTGKVARVPGDRQYFLGPNIAMIRPTTNYVLPAYLELYLRSPMGNRLSLSFAKAVAQPSLSMGTIRMISVALPPPSEQERIVAEVERLLDLAETTLKATQANLARALRLRQSILKWAFEGKLADQDPSDEPASALLARIKAERDATQPAKKKSRA